MREGVKAVTPTAAVLSQGGVTAAALSYTGDICPHHKKEQGRKGGLQLLFSATQEIFALITKKEPGRKGEELPFSLGPSK